MGADLMSLPIVEISIVGQPSLLCSCKERVMQLIVIPRILYVHWTAHRMHTRLCAYIDTHISCKLQLPDECANDLPA